MRATKAAARALVSFWETASELGDHLGPLLVQLPGSAPADRRVLSEFLKAAPDGVRLAFEFRGSSWRTEATLRTLSSHNAALVLTDHGEGPPALELTADFAYVRIRREDEQAEVWAEWAERLVALTRRGIDVYAYLKHDRRGLALERAKRLSILLRGESAQREQSLLT